MKNADRWTPSKYVFRGGTLRASRDHRHVAPSSWLVADKVARRYAVALPKHAQGRLLDFGCGLVPFYEAYRQFVSNIVCIDWKHSLHASPYLDETQDLSGVIGLESQSFDTILVSDVLEHLPAPALSWSELYRLLTRGGKVILNVPFYYGLHEQPHDYYRFTEHALRLLAEDVGFTVVELEAIGGVPEILADIVAKSLGNRALGRGLGTVLQRGVSMIGATKVGASISRRSSARSPLGYFMVAQR